MQKNSIISFKLYVKRMINDKITSKIANNNANLLIKKNTIVCLSSIPFSTNNAILSVPVIIFKLFKI